MIALDPTTISESNIKSPIRTATNLGYGVFISSSQGESFEYKQVETEISHQDRTQITHVLESADIAEFECRAEHLKDLLEANRTALSEQEIRVLKGLFNNSNQLIKLNKQTSQREHPLLADLQCVRK